MKLWNKCSKAEKRQFAKIEKEYKDCKEKFKKGEIDKNEYNNTLDDLMKRLNALEEKYDV